MLNPDVAVATREVGRFGPARRALDFLDLLGLGILQRSHNSILVGWPRTPY
jgi:hypothetical protein